MSISDEFFRTTFELMGHVAKSDGRVTEAEIDAARRLMHELKLGSRPKSASPSSAFRTGKSAAYDAELGVERLREACGQRYDLLRAFMELQLRAALAGNGISPPARGHTDPGGRAAGHVRPRICVSWRPVCAPGSAPRAPRAAVPQAQARGRLAECYAELEVDAGISDPEVTKAYRRQMSRHHPDKLVANGLPESMAQMAKEKTQRIQEAYEAIRAARGMR